MSLLLAHEDTKVQGSLKGQKHSGFDSETFDGTFSPGMWTHVVSTGQAGRESFSFSTVYISGAKCRSIFLLFHFCTSVRQTGLTAFPLSSLSCGSRCCSYSLTAATCAQLIIYQEQISGMPQLRCHWDGKSHINYSKMESFSSAFHRSETPTGKCLIGLWANTQNIH